MKILWTRSRLFAALTLAFLCGACPQTSRQDTASGLGGTSWQLVKFQSSDDKTLTPDDKSKYTIAFGTDGRGSRCNRGSGTWKSAAPNQLQFGPMASRARCARRVHFMIASRKIGRLFVRT